MTQGEFAKRVNTGLDRFGDLINGRAWPNEDTKELFAAGAFLSMNFLMNAMGLKQPEEGLKPCLDRLLAYPDLPLDAANVPTLITAEQMDLMNPEHRQVLANSIRSMFGPIGINRMLLIGLSEEEEGLSEKVFVAQVNRNGLPPFSNIKELFEQLAAGHDTDPSEDIVL
jgi:hypothetical protein